MSKPRRTKDFVEAETARRRAIIDHYDHEHAYVAAKAMEMYVAAVEQMDGQFPDPDKRRAATVAREMAEDFRVANVGRMFVEGAE